MNTTTLLDQTAARDRLRARLEDGDRRIAEAQRAGQDVTEWETFWIRLLREYEAACRAVDDVAGTVVLSTHAVSPLMETA